eukprot:GCRY01003793.1.p1 GENE.GCRY01003793.1~~GCRY01003793.1.p1  ORF type:complete len:549 (-),score=96.65 GCRY01003793.1:429-2075(-)
MDYRLFISGLFEDVTQNDLETLFSSFGKISDVHIPLNGFCDRKCRGFAYCTLHCDESHHQNCLSALNSTKWKGKTLKIGQAKEAFHVKRSREVSELKAEEAERIQKRKIENKLKKCYGPLTVTDPSGKIVKATSGIADKSRRRTSFFFSEPAERSASSLTSSCPNLTETGVRHVASSNVGQTERNEEEQEEVGEEKSGQIQMSGEKEVQKEKGVLSLDALMDDGEAELGDLEAMFKKAAAKAESMSARSSEFIELQTRIGHDERFQMSEEFYSDSEESGQTTDAAVLSDETEETLKAERETMLSLLVAVVPSAKRDEGEDNESRLLSRKPRPVFKLPVRYDPLNPTVAATLLRPLLPSPAQADAAEAEQSRWTNTVAPEAGSKGYVVEANLAAVFSTVPKEGFSLLGGADVGDQSTVSDGFRLLGTPNDTDVSTGSFSLLGNTRSDEKGKVERTATESGEPSKTHLPLSVDLDHFFFPIEENISSVKPAVEGADSAQRGPATTFWRTEPKEKVLETFQKKRSSLAHDFKQKQKKSVRLAKKTAQRYHR